MYSIKIQVFDEASGEEIFRTKIGRVTEDRIFVNGMKEDTPSLLAVGNAVANAAGGSIMDGEKRLLRALHADTATIGEAVLIIEELRRRAFPKARQPVCEE